MRKVLVVDDSAINRTILNNLLAQEYQILEAENGAVAIDVLRSTPDVSAVLLDIVMPVMNGYDTLKVMKEDKELSNIPVIVITGSEDESSRVKALEAGANDFIVKPYNIEIVRHCLHNNIVMQETEAAVGRLQNDRLTGIYNRDTFFEKAAEFIEAKEPGYYIMACFDIDNFKVINDQYGTDEGDKILRHIGARLKETFNKVDGLCCRISGDNFAGLFPNDEATRKLMTDSRQNAFLPNDVPSTVAFSAGRYVIKDKSLSMNSMYDRAYIAKQTAKGRYDLDEAYFDDSMLEDIVRRQQITNDMDKALSQEQFEVYMQPQFNHATGALVGAEALVRWRHPEKGLIPPSDFVPVFESNGFIYELDKFVWDRTCKQLRAWLDEGRQPLPVSVNISRYDILRPDVIETLLSILKKHDISVELLRVEITESAFSGESRKIVDTVKRLIDLGFTVEIDDFGSGYSSLNTLKDVPAQILKLDMRFLEDSQDAARGGNILESIVRMAKWLGMSVIAEGVERIEQADFLKSIGCNYIQGYLYAKPMPIKEYDNLARNVTKEEKLLALDSVKKLNNTAFWDPASLDTFIFNTFVGGACIFEYSDGAFELIRATDEFVKVVGGTSLTSEDVLRLDWINHLEEQSRLRAKSAIMQSRATGEEVGGEYEFINIPGCPAHTFLQAGMRVIATVGHKMLIYCRCENTTARKAAEERERTAVEQMQTIMRNMAGGVTATVIEGDSVKYLFANVAYYSQLGYTKEQFEAEVSVPFDLVHPDDRDYVRRETWTVNTEGATVTLVYRIVRRDGGVRWLKSNISTMEFPDVDKPVQLSVANDITDQQNAAKLQSELLDNLPCGAALYLFKDDVIEVLHTNSRFLEMTGSTDEKTKQGSALELVHPDDKDGLLKTMGEVIAENKAATRVIRILCGDGEYRSFEVSGRIIDRGMEGYAVFATYIPFDENKRPL